MASIGSIRLGYGDTKLFNWLMTVSPAEVPPTTATRPDAGLPLHVIEPLTLEKLGTAMVRINYEYSGESRVEETYDNTAYEGMILFSRQKEGSILTDANTCFSYMLHCRGLHLGAAVHVSALYAQSPEVHKDMLYYAIANMGRLAPNMPLTAHISGGFAFTEPGITPELTDALSGAMKPFMVANNEMVVKYTVSELMRRGITVGTIDIGRDYQYQELELHTGRYMASTHNIANEKVKRLFRR